MIGKDLDLIDRSQLHASGFIVTTFFSDNVCFL